MPQQKSLVARIIVLVLAIFVSAILLLPNLATRKLQIAFQNYQHTSDSLPAISKEQIQDFLQDPDNGLPFFFPGKKCVILKINGNDGNAGGDSPPDWNPQDDIALATQAKPTELQERSKSDNPLGQTRCILEDRFLSSAKINTLIQAFPNLIEEKNTVLLPHFAERMISELLGRPKQLAIKLGLDLQGGMRVILRADFESYRTRIEEKIAALRKDSQTAKAIDKALTPETQKTKIVDPIDFSNLDRIETSKETPNSEEIQTRIDNLEIARNLDTGQRQLLLEETREILEKRLAAQNITEAEIRSNTESDSISIDLPGVGKAKEVLEKIRNTVNVEYRIVEAEKTNAVNGLPENQQELQFLKEQAKRQNYDPKIERKILDKIAKRSNIAPNRLFLYWRRAYNPSANPENTKLLPREFRVLGPPEMDGGDMESAFANPDPSSGGWYQISFRLTDFGARKFGNLTQANKGEQLAILWGNRIVSDPVIREPIYGGNGVINGNFTENEAREIAGVIREGALPMPLEIVSINSIGPSLGIESIQTGMIAILLSFIIVMAFLIFYYRWWGLNAILVLLLNLLFLSAIMSFLGFTFTLPGFAGIVLTIGIAIDASVIIFERLKEELRENQSLRLSVEKSFQTSFWTVLDANVTTLIATIILWLPKDGPIMGFAIVLFFGLLVSMYTALTVSRLFFDILTRIRNPVPRREMEIRSSLPRLKKTQ